MAKRRLEAINDFLERLAHERDPEEQELLVDRINEIHRDYLDTHTRLAQMLKRLPAGVTSLRDQFTGLPARAGNLPLPEEINAQKYFKTNFDACHEDNARLAGHDEDLGRAETALWWTGLATDIITIGTGVGGLVRAGAKAYADDGARALWGFVRTQGKIVGGSVAAAYGVAWALRQGGTPEPAIDVGMRVFETVMATRAVRLADKMKGVPELCKTNKAADFDSHRWGDPDTIPCFPAETLVHTPDGLRPIHALREGDLVMSYDSMTNQVVARQIVSCMGNWTQHLVKMKIGEEIIWSTRVHPFFLPDTGQWLPATQLKPGMTVLGIDLKPRTIDDVQLMGTHEDTYNISVADFHTFFVGEVGLLVHNSSFENLQQVFTEIYAVRDPSLNVVYVGKTIQGLDARFQQHISGPHPHWAKGYTIDALRSGNWTTFESSVWEEHFFDAHGGKTALENKQLPITEAKYKKFKSLHNPC
jgi:hypothetical protein